MCTERHWCALICVRDQSSWLSDSFPAVKWASHSQFCQGDPWWEPLCLAEQALPAKDTPVLAMASTAMRCTLTMNSRRQQRQHQHNASNRGPSQNTASLRHRYPSNMHHCVTMDHLRNDAMQHTRTPFPTIPGSNFMGTLERIGREGR